MTPEEKRRAFQKLKSLSSDSFWTQMNILHTRAYSAAEKHYHEAMFIELTPKQRAAVIAKAKEIREKWDGMKTVTTEATDMQIFYGVQDEAHEGGEACMTEEQVIDQLSNYKRIIARIKVLENYSVGAGITVSRLNQDDQLMELHRRLRGMPTYMYLTKREQKLETTAHAYLGKYPSGTRAQLNAVPVGANDAEDDKLLRELRQKIEKVIEARTGSKDGFEAVIERISELQDLQAQRDQIDAALEALESYKPDYAKLLRLLYVDGLAVTDTVAEMRMSKRAFWRQRSEAEREYKYLAR